MVRFHFYETLEKVNLNCIDRKNTQGCLVVGVGKVGEGYKTIQGNADSILEIKENFMSVLFIIPYW